MSTHVPSSYVEHEVRSGVLSETNALRKGSDANWPKSCWWLNPFWSGDSWMGSKEWKDINCPYLILQFEKGGEGKIVRQQRIQTETYINWRLNGRGATRLETPLRFLELNAFFFSSSGEQGLLFINCADVALVSFM